MKRGPKPDIPSMKLARGTFRPHRDGAVVEMVEPTALPMQPEWLTEGGRDVWLDEIGRVSSVRLATERDSMMFANYCNLQGAIIQAWQAGEVPPAAVLIEVRKLAEQFGLFGVKSRVKVAAAEDRPSNPFSRNGRGA
jgi:hypothetical protein